MTLYKLKTVHVIVVIVAIFSEQSLVPEAHAFKYHQFCVTPPVDMKTRFPLYRLEVDTKIDGIPWAYRQNNTLTGELFVI